MFRAGMVCYPWDLIDGRIDDALAFIQGELGAGAVTLVAGCAPIERLVLRADRRPASTGRQSPGGTRHSGAGLGLLRTGGGLLFQPNESKYANTRCRPVRSDWLKSRDSNAEAADACRARGLLCRVAISTMRLGRMAARYPAAAVKNILGEPSPTRLCPSNPDVVELVCGLVADLSARCAPDGIELHDFDRSCRGRAAAGLECPAGLGDVGDALLSLCFCESCRQGATRSGTDAEAAERTVEMTLRALLARAERGPGSWSDLLERDAILRRYVTWQAEALADHLAAVRARCGGGLLLARRGDEIAFTADLHALSRHVDRVVVSQPVSEGPQILATIEATRSQCRTGCTVAVEFSLRGGGASPQTLVADVAAAAEAGVDDATFADLGLLAPDWADAVKQAIRYARRTASA